MDPVTAVGGGLAILGSKEVLNKILGPTADYVGGEMKGLVEKCNVNIENIFAAAKRKLGNRLEEVGTVNPRILKNVLDEGRFCEDEVGIEYYGGILAGSKGLNGRNDSALPFISKVKNMPNIQLRIHYAIYFEFLRQFQDMDINLGEGKQALRTGIFIPFVFFTKILPQDNEIRMDQIGSATTWLYNEGLLGNFALGSKEHVMKSYPEASDRGIYVTPTLMGAELFLWAHGSKEASGAAFFDHHDIITNPIIAVPPMSEKK